MPTVSAVLIIKNEERHIRACLEHLTWADEMVVVDSLSTDNTVAICRQFTPKVYQHPFFSLPHQRNIALRYARGDWVWVMDADERVPEPLREEILGTLRGPAAREYVAFWVPRRNIILGRWVRHAGWYPDYQLRLFRRAQVRYDERFQGHERMLIEGKAGYLQEPYIHYNYERLGQLFRKQDFYAHLEARSLCSFGLRARPQNFLLQPLREFKRRFVDGEGYREGLHGLLLCLIMAWYNFLVYQKLVKLSGMEWRVGRRYGPPVPT